MNKMSEDTEKNILYELFIFAEWVQEPELVTNFGYGQENPHNKSLLSWFGSRASCVSDLLECHINSQLPWSILIGNDQKLVAVLRGNSIEIRNAKDEFATVVATCALPHDPHPKWRRMAWAPDLSFLIVSMSNGRILSFDTGGNLLFTIKEDDLTTINDDFEYAHAGLLFSDLKTTRSQWSYELITVSYGGSVRAFFVRADSKDFMPSFSFELPTNHGSLGDVVYYQKHHMILVGGSCARNMELANADDPTLVASEAGITAWKITKEEPFLEKVQTLHQSTKTGILAELMSYIRNSCEDVVSTLRVSPDGNQLLCTHTSGVVTLWSLPGLILLKLWRSYDLPCYKDTNPHLNEAEKIMQQKMVGFNNVVLADWWSDDSIIVVRRCGSIIVVSLETERNLLGDYPEWFAVSPRLAALSGKGFLTIECEWQMGLSKTRANSSFIGSELESSFMTEEDGEDLGNNQLQVDSGWLATSLMFAPLRKILYYVTDRDPFDSTLKTRRVCKIYRLLGVKSTTPEELFAVKINNEEFQEALNVATMYELDQDPVYQKQWRKNPISKTTIMEFLDQVKNQSWVLQECLQRIPTDIVACRELLLYGLRKTDVFVLKKLSEDELKDIEDPLDEEVKRQQILNELNFDKLNLDQKWICECRYKFLTYLDRLQIFEGFQEEFDVALFEQFRQMSPLEACIFFARRGDIEAVVSLMTYYHKDVILHWLVILTQLPETISPNEYSKLLPYASTKPPYSIRPWQAAKIRNETDWVEEKFSGDPFLDMWNCFQSEFYDDNPECEQWMIEKLSMETVAKWYFERIKQIEELTMLVDNALELCRLAFQKNIRCDGLTLLQDDLLTVDLLTYDCHLEMVTLQDIQQKSDYDKLALIMGNTTEMNFLNCFRNWLLPFVERCERHVAGSKFHLIREYLTELAKDHLDRIQQIFKMISEDPASDFILSDIGDRIELCLSCCYASDKPAHVECVSGILNAGWLPDKVEDDSDERMRKLYEELNELEKLLHCAECLAHYHNELTVKQIKELSDKNQELIEIFERTSLKMSKKKLSAGEWVAFANDISEMHRDVFKNMDIDLCFEKICLALIGSANRENIMIAGGMLSLNNNSSFNEQKQTMEFPHKLSQETSLKIMLKAGQDYFDSSTSPRDSCLALSRSCLNLIEGVGGDAVRRELDLMAALPILYSLGLQMLPVHVRSHDKLTIIREVLIVEKQNYKNFSKLNDLSKYLRLFENDEHRRQGTIKNLVADMAIRESDYKFASKMCHKMISMEYCEGWKSCARLATCEEYDDFSDRRSLLDFCIANAPGEFLEKLLKEKNNVDLQEYYHSLEQKFSKSEMSLKNIPKDAVDTSKKLLSSIARPDFWLETVKGTVKTFASGPANISIDESPLKRCSSVEREAFTLYSLPAYYDGLWNKQCLPSRQSYDFRSFEIEDIEPPHLANVLHYASVADCVNSTKSVMSLNDDMVLELAREYIFDDVLLALCHLMQLRDKLKADEFFLNLPYTSQSLELAAYFFSLVALDQEGKGDSEERELYLALARDDLVAKVLQMQPQVQDEDAKQSIALVEKFEGLRRDLDQAQLLQEQSGGSIDVGRFSHDEIYKRETILGMALSEDPDTLKVALNLAKHYDVNSFDVLLGHLEHLFLVNMPAKEIESRLSEEMLATLFEDKQKMRKLLEERVLPLISGSNHDHMLLYYNLLQRCCQTESGQKRVDAYIALLKAFSDTCRSADFKLLISADKEEQKRALQDLVDEENVEDMAKLCGKYKVILKNINRSTVLQVFLMKEFIASGQLDKSELKDLFKLHLKYIRFLSQSDLIDFIQGVCFNDDSARLLSRGYRLEILKSFVAFAKSMTKLPKKESTDPLSWEDVLSRLTGYLQHLQKIEDGFVNELLDIEVDERLNNYIHAFEMSAGEKDKLEELLVQCTLCECDTPLLQSLLSICPSNTINHGPLYFYIKAFKVALTQLSIESKIDGDEKDKKDRKDLPIIFQTRKPIVIMRRLLTAGSKASEGDGSFDTNIVELVRPFCLDMGLALSSRLEVLRLLKQTATSLSSDDESLLLHLETMALLQERWPEVHVSQSETESTEGRISVFIRLLEATHSVGQLDTLCSLITSWPQMQMSQSVWFHLMTHTAIMKDCPAEKCLSILQLSRLQTDIPLSECEAILTSWGDRFTLREEVLFKLGSPHVELHRQAVANISGLTSKDITDAVCDKILDLDLISSVVSCEHYGKVIERLLARDDYEELSERTINSLRQDGYQLEAATLFALTSGVPKALITFTNSLAAFSSWTSR